MLLVLVYTYSPVYSTDLRLVHVWQEAGTVDKIYRTRNTTTILSKSWRGPNGRDQLLCNGDINHAHAAFAGAAGGGSLFNLSAKSLRTIVLRKTRIVEKIRFLDSSKGSYVRHKKICSTCGTLDADVNK
jgi:hypothetical protein